MMFMSKKWKNWINEADAIVIGAGAGLSTAAGLEYGGKTFLNYFQYMKDLYGYEDMYSAGIHSFSSLEEQWGYWAKFIYINRYKPKGLPLYKKIFQLFKDRNYFVITTNVDHQFQKSGFDKKRLFYAQGDYGLFQCSKPCHNKTYDNEKSIMEMISKEKEHKIPTEMIPLCPKCGLPMCMNLRSDETFVEDEQWQKAAERYVDFLRENKERKIVFLELGVGFNTPSIIKFPFMQMTYEMPNAHYICVNRGYNSVYDEIKEKSMVLNMDINDFIKEYEEEV